MQYGLLADLMYFSIQAERVNLVAPISRPAFHTIVSWRDEPEVHPVNRNTGPPSAGACYSVHDLRALSAVSWPTRPPQNLLTF